MGSLSLLSNNLTGWDLSGQNLTGADFSLATLNDVDFTAANITGATFYNASMLGLTAEQFYSTASYQLRDLRDMSFSVFFPNGWDLSYQDFSGSTFFRTWFEGTNLSHADLTNTSWRITAGVADFTGADFRGSSGLSLSSTIYEGFISASGTIASLSLMDGEKLLIRDYDGNPATSPPVAPISIHVQDHFSISGNGTLFMIFEADEWNSTISFDPGIPVTLGGILDLNFKEDVNITSQIGRTLDLFDWTGVSPTGAFTVESPYTWDLTDLYTTGEVTLLSASSLPGDFDSDGDVDGRDLLAWQRDPSLGSLTSWQANYGDAVAGLSAFVAVPEPATPGLIAAALFGLTVLNKRRF